MFIIYIYRYLFILLIQSNNKKEFISFHGIYKLFKNKKYQIYGDLLKRFSIYYYALAF